MSILLLYIPNFMNNSNNIKQSLEPVIPDTTPSKPEVKTTIPFLMLILFFAKILGFIKLRVIAELFGGTRELDIFWAAFAIPDTVFNVLIAGSVNAAIIPVFTDILVKKGDKYLSKLFIKMNIYLSLILIVFSIIIVIFAEPISQFLINGGQFSQIFEISPDLKADNIGLLALLMRIMSLSPILLGISSIITGYLQVYRKFEITQIAPIVYNFIIIILALIFVKIFNLGVIGMAWAVILGSVAHLAVQLPKSIKFLVKDNNWKEIVSFENTSGEVRKIFKLTLPRALTILGDQIISIFNTIVGLSLTSGALSAYKYAFSLHVFPAQLITNSISLVSLPEFSEMHSKSDMNQFKEKFNNALQRSVFLIMPFVGMLIILRLPIVRLALGGGNFTWENTLFTSWCLALLSFNMLSQVVSAITIRAFYAIHETKLPLITMLITVFINLVLTYFFVNFFSHYSDWRPIVSQIISQLSNGEVSEVISSWGTDLIKWFITRNYYDYAVGGIALSLTVSYLFESAVNLLLLNKKIRVVTWIDTVFPILKKISITFIMMVVMYFVYRYSDKYFDTSYTINVFIVLVISCSVGGLIYILLSRILKLPELFLVTTKLQLLIKLIYEKIFKKAV